MVSIVFVDANVLYSRTLRDWLFLLRQETGGEVFTLASTWDVLTEVGSHLRNSHPTSAGRLVSLLVKKFELYVDEIVEDFPGGVVPWIADEGDWHVHHAATACGADYLLAEDKGFDDLHCTYRLYTCDDFFMDLYEAAPKAVAEVARAQKSYWAKTANNKTLVEALHSAGCPRFAAAVSSLL